MPGEAKASSGRGIFDCGGVGAVGHQKIRGCSAAPFLHKTSGIFLPFDWPGCGAFRFKKESFIASGGVLWPCRGMCVMVSASQLEVGELVGSAGAKWNDMVDLQAVSSSADNAHPVAVVDEGSDPAPVPA
jgi:hypothetical protein